MNRRKIVESDPMQIPVCS